MYFTQQKDIDIDGEQQWGNYCEGGENQAHELKVVGYTCKNM